MKVTHQILSVLVLLTLSIAVTAQTSIGIRTGIHFAEIDAPKEIAGVGSFIKPVTSISVGLITEFKINEQFSFQPELGYARKGFKLSEGLDLNLFKVPLPLGVKTVTSFDYIEVPLLLKYQFGNEQIKAHVFGGPNMGYATSGRLKTSARVFFDIPLTNTSLDLDNIGYKRFEIGGTVGAGLSVNAGAGQLFVDARYTHGFNKLYDIPVVDIKLRNHSFGVNIGYMVPLNGA